MNELYYEFDYQGKVVSDSLILPNEPATQKIFPLDIKNDIDNELKLFLMTKILIPLTGYIFYTPAGYTSAIHVDGQSLHQRPALNFVLSDDYPGVMKWYNLKDGVNAPAPTITSNSTFYLQAKEENVFEIRQHRLTKPCLVNTGIFHNVVNESDKGRWCISIRFDHRLSFADALSKLSFREVS
jgi:hypothetical protein